MDADRPGNAVTDDGTLDRELQALLGVEPPPEFAARVRTRIAHEPPASRSWLLAWTVAASVVAAAAIVMLAVSVLRPRGDDRPSPALEARRLPALEVPAVTPGLHAPVNPVVDPLGVSGPVVNPRVDHAVAASSVNPAVASRAAIEPEILVDPREARALRELIVGTRDGHIDLAPVVTASTPAVMELPPIADIEIPAIDIKPIAPDTGEEGVRQ